MDQTWLRIYRYLVFNEKLVNWQRCICWTLKQWKLSFQSNKNFQTIHLLDSISRNINHTSVYTSTICSQLHGRYTQRRRQYVTPILRPQKFGKGKPLPHRWLGISTSLPSHGYGVTSLYLYCNNEAIHRCTYNVCAHKRNTKRCAQHILLDPSYLHIVFSPLETSWSGCSSSWGRQNEGWSG